VVPHAHFDPGIGSKDLHSKGYRSHAGAAEWADMEAAGQLGSPLREADAALIQLAPLRPYAAGAHSLRSHVMPKP
jgi:hypothetical protein